MSNLTFLIVVNLINFSTPAMADTESMTAMPLIKPKKIYTVPTKEAGEELLEQRGFGDKEPEVRMMNLMMVGGSGYEGMDMEEMKMADNKTPTSAHQGHSMANMPSMKMDANTDQNNVEISKAPESAKVGPNIFEFAVMDSKKQSIKSLKIKAEVFMTSMDMGTETPKVKEIKPGLYQVKAIFSMKGPWAIKITAPATEKTLSVDVK